MSRKFAVISYDSNKDYSFFKPIVEWCWSQLSWEVISLDADEIKRQANGSLDKYSSAIISQCSRLYASQLYNLNEDDYIMTSDVDMIPLGQFNQFYISNPDEITSFGKDLTDYHYPICYIGMKVKKWREVMDLNGLTVIKALERDLLKYENKWTTDQDIITEKLNNFDVKIIPRGSLPTGLPVGRLDRYNWQEPKAKIDCHALRPGYVPENWTRIKQAIQESFDYPQWMDEYALNFNKQ